jgi:hypothetical protein
MANFFDQFDGASEPSSGPDYGKAISSIESGGNYRAIGPATKTGDRALGKYQVMGANVGPWSREILGREVSPREFIANDEIQDAIFKGKFGQYAEKYGPEGAARAWFAGEKGMNNPNAKDVLGTTVASYGAKFNKALGYAPEEKRPTDVSAQAKPKANFFDQFDATAEPEVAQPSIAERSDMTGGAPKNAPALQEGLEAQAVQRTRGEPVSTAAQITTNFLNQGSAAGQRTSPHIEAHQKNLISTKTFENEAGELLYEDNAGNLVKTDSNKHVALRDPADGVIKVYARSENTDEGVLSSAGRLMMSGMGAGAPTARPAIPTPTAAAIRPRASDILSTAKPHYKEFDAAAKEVFVAPKQIVDRVTAALDKANQPKHLAEEVHNTVGEIIKGGSKQPSALQKLEAEMNGLPVPGGESELVPLSRLRDIKELVGKSFQSQDKRVRDAAAVASKEINKIISEIDPAAGASLKKADEIFSTARSVQDLQRKSDVAGLRAGRAGFGGNAVNTMRQVLSPIVQKSIEGKMTGFKPDEIAAMREIVEGTTATNTARLVGQLSPTSGLGVLKSAAAGGSAVGVGVSGGAALAIPAIGYASNKLATVLTGRQIERLKELVAKRSPAYSEAVAKSVKRYEDSQLAFINDPSPARLGTYVASSRALSSGLSKDGVSVSAGDLMRALQGPVPSRAEDEQR